jgi:hypothetical protein
MIIILILIGCSKLLFLAGSSIESSLALAHGLMNEGCRVALIHQRVARRARRSHTIPGRLEQVGQRGVELLGTEGLRDTLGGGPGIGHAQAPVARAEGKRYAAVGEGRGDRERVAADDIDVQDRHIEVAGACVGYPVVKVSSSTMNTLGERFAMLAFIFIDYFPVFSCQGIHSNQCRPDGVKCTCAVPLSSRSMLR